MNKKNLNSIGVLIVIIAIFISAYLEAEGFVPYFFVEGVWYASYQFFPLVGSVAIISHVRRSDICIAG